MASLSAALFITTLVPAQASAVNLFETDSSGCLIRVPVAIDVTNQYAAAYDNGKVLIRIRPIGGVTVTNMVVEMRTFGGDQIAESGRVASIRKPRTVRLKLRFDVLQAGRFTVIVTGEPNTADSCGPKQIADTVSYRVCPGRLPIRFPDRPRGIASDYEDVVSVPVEATGSLVRGVRSEIYSFAGERFGTASVGALFGRGIAQHRLNQDLQPGGYSVIFEGREAGVPQQCGAQVRKLLLRFR